MRHPSNNSVRSDLLSNQSTEEETEYPGLSPCSFPLRASESAIPSLFTGDDVHIDFS